MIKIDRNDDCTNDHLGRKATSSYCFEMIFPYKIKREISDLIILTQILIHHPVLFLLDHHFEL